MRTGDIADSLFCVGMAIAKDLPDIEYTTTDWHKFNEEKSRRAKTSPPKSTDEKFQVKATRRPYSDDLEVYSFPQTWSDTSLGFGGLAGQAFTTAQTTVVVCEELHAAVYFGRQFAYVVDCRSNPTVFWDDVRHHRMVAVRDRAQYSKALAGKAKSS